MLVLPTTCTATVPHLFSLTTPTNTRTKWCTGGGSPTSVGSVARQTDITPLTLSHPHIYLPNPSTLSHTAPYPSHITLPLLTLHSNNPPLPHYTPTSLPSHTTLPHPSPSHTTLPHPSPPTLYPFTPSLPTCTFTNSNIIQLTAHSHH